MAEPQINESVVLWTRPRADAVVMLGEGIFVGWESVNSYHCPVVRMTTGNPNPEVLREIVVHYDNVWVKAKDEAERILSMFSGQVRNVDIERWLDPNFQTMLRRELGDPNAVPAPNSETALDLDNETPREDETGLEKVARLTRRRKRLLAKRQLYEQGIESINEEIRTTNQEIREHKDEILQLLADEEGEEDTRA